MHISQATSVTNDEVILVDSEDHVLGAMDKVEAHRHPAQLHRAISVWLINSQGELLLQQRSLKKITGGGWWGNGVCGNVWPGESYLDCAYRRLKVELGIKNPKEAITLHPCFKFEYRAYINQEFGENELDQVFVATFDGELKPNPEEVTAVAWVKTQKFTSFFQKLDFVSPTETLEHETSELVGITPDELYPWNGKALLITPWTIMMARDERLSAHLSTQ